MAVEPLRSVNRKVICRMSSTIPDWGPEHVPAQIEQAAAGRVKEEVDCFRLGDCAVAGESQRIDTIERLAVTAPDKRFEF